MAEFFFLSPCGERGGYREQGKKEEDCVVAPSFLAWLGAGLKKKCGASVRESVERDVRKVS